MSPAKLLVPTYLQMLAMLSAWLDKAEQQQPAGEADALLAARLAPDMFPLSTQIRFACVQAVEGMHRLRGEDLPALVGTLLEEGHRCGDRPGTLAEAQERIAETIALVRSLAEGANMEDDQPIAHTIPNGMIFDLTAEQYARDWVIAHFYFHVMAAYTILRSKGIDLGKADYVAYMLEHVRPGTMPEA